MLAPWETFYLIVGSVAGALIGLQFVVMALIADSRRRATSPEIAAFGTPTVLHFCGALLVSALMSVPWGSVSGLRAGLIACGGYGVAYVAVVIRRARRSAGYRAELEDWVWHAALPLIAYVALTVGAVRLSQGPDPALPLIAAATLGLAFIGIHNSWDSITFVATDASHGHPKPKR